MEPPSTNPQPLKPQSPSLIQHQSGSPSQAWTYRDRVSVMDLGFPALEESESTTLIDWGDLLDFAVENDQFPLPSPPPFGSDEAPVAVECFQESADRVRKRDPKLTCENFLAGRVPCACPEMDALLAEDEEQRGTGKKRARTVRAAAATGVVASCRVPGCEVDISELKGYHKRHRVCLKCSTASAVVLYGESKRFCQQCGKFHVLPDFDEGKRSCRRKLERHNKRRRRKHTKGSTEEETQGDPLVEKIGCDVEADKAIVAVTTKAAPNGGVVRSEDVHLANMCSSLGSRDTQSDSPGSDETNLDKMKDRSLYGPSSSNGDNKGTFSSVCPSGRISFKLYDWNPAEFPRRLRHQIFQWLASMPVELEGYIRPGCTILTVFLSMPKFMWVELFKDPASQLQDFISAPGRLLSGKGTIHVYLNNMRFLIASVPGLHFQEAHIDHVCGVNHQVFDTDTGLHGTFVKKVLTDVQAPKLHYVHPIFFEAGKPMEFVACGSNLPQQKFRFLVSFQEKYVASEYYLFFSSSHSEFDSTRSFNHQKYKIYASLTDSDAFGPAFIEVENQSGLSNYIPVLIGDKEICAELERIQQNCVHTFFSESSVYEPDNCEVYLARHSALSEFVLDIAWLLKKPASESLQDNLISSQIKRYCSVLNYLLHNDSKVILDRVLKSLSIRISNAEKSSPGYTTCEDGIRLLKKRMDQASNTLRLKRCSLTSPSTNSLLSDVLESSIQYERTSAVHIDEEDANTRTEYKSVSLADSSPAQGSETVPLLCTDDKANMKHTDKWPRQSCSAIMSSTRMVPHSRATASLVAVALVCIGVCAVIIHPDKVGQFSVTVRRCLFDRSYYYVHH